LRDISDSKSHNFAGLCESLLLGVLALQVLEINPPPGIKLRGLDGRCWWRVAEKVDLKTWPELVKLRSVENQSEFVISFM
jgi:hypothetical protein